MILDSECTFRPDLTKKPSPKKFKTIGEVGRN
jgi:hypothetical protein